jgi:dolichol-phosphate mannosyltransferase
MKPVDVSVILPCYNERDNILLIIDRLLHVLAESAWELVVVDDNSPDGTAELVRTQFGNDPRIHLIVRTRERGLANSIRDGIETASGQIIVVMDTDFNHNPDDVPLMCHIARRVDIVVGSRFIFGGGMPHKGRYYASYLYNLGMRLLLGTRMDDNLSGFFAAPKAVLLRLDLDKIFFGHGDYFFRLLLKSQESGFRHVQVPVVYSNRHAGVTKMGILRIFAVYTREVFRVFWMKVTGRW